MIIFTTGTIICRMGMINSILQIIVATTETSVSKRISVIDDPNRIISGPGSTIAGADSILDTSVAIIFVGKQIISTAEMDVFKTDTTISSFDTLRHSPEMIRTCLPKLTPSAVGGQVHLAHVNVTCISQLPPDDHSRDRS